MSGPGPHGCRKETVEAVLETIESGDRLVWNSNHFDHVEANSSSVGKALGYLAAEGDLVLYSAGGQRRSYVLPESPLVDSAEGGETA